MMSFYKTFFVFIYLNNFKISLSQQQQLEKFVKKDKINEKKIPWFIPLKGLNKFQPFNDSKDLNNLKIPFPQQQQLSLEKFPQQQLENFIKIDKYFNEEKLETISWFIPLKGVANFQPCSDPINILTYKTYFKNFSYFKLLLFYNLFVETKEKDNATYIIDFDFKSKIQEYFSFQVKRKLLFDNQLSFFKEQEENSSQFFLLITSFFNIFLIQEIYLNSFLISMNFIEIKDISCQRFSQKINLFFSNFKNFKETYFEYINFIVFQNKNNFSNFNFIELIKDIYVQINTLDKILLNICENIDKYKSIVLISREKYLSIKYFFYKYVFFTLKFNIQPYIFQFDNSSLEFLDKFKIKNYQKAISKSFKFYEIEENIEKKIQAKVQNLCKNFISNKFENPEDNSERIFENEKFIVITLFQKSNLNFLLHESRFITIKTQILNKKEDIMFFSKEEYEVILKEKEKEEREQNNNQSQIINNQSQIIDNQSQIIDNQSQIINNQSQIIDNQSQIIDNQSQQIVIKKDDHDKEYFRLNLNEINIKRIQMAEMYLFTTENYTRKNTKRKNNGLKIFQKTSLEEIKINEKNTHILNIPFKKLEVKAIEYLSEEQEIYKLYNQFFSSFQENKVLPLGKKINMEKFEGIRDFYLKKQINMKYFEGIKIKKSKELFFFSSILNMQDKISLILIGLSRENINLLQMSEENIFFRQENIFYQLNTSDQHFKSLNEREENDNNIIGFIILQKIKGIQKYSLIKRNETSIKIEKVKIEKITGEQFNLKTCFSIIKNSQLNKYYKYKFQIQNSKNNKKNVEDKLKIIKDQFEQKDQNQCDFKLKQKKIKDENFNEKLVPLVEKQIEISIEKDYIKIGNIKIDFFIINGIKRLNIEHLIFNVIDNQFELTTSNCFPINFKNYKYSKEDFKKKFSYLFSLKSNLKLNENKYAKLILDRQDAINFYKSRFKNQFDEKNIKIQLSFESLKMFPELKKDMNGFPYLLFRNFNNRYYPIYLIENQLFLFFKNKLCQLMLINSQIFFIYYSFSTSIQQQNNEKYFSPMSYIEFLKYGHNIHFMKRNLRIKEDHQCFNIYSLNYENLLNRICLSFNEEEDIKYYLINNVFFEKSFSYENHNYFTLFHFKNFNKNILEIKELINDKKTIKDEEIYKDFKYTLLQYPTEEENIQLSLKIICMFLNSELDPKKMEEIYQKQKEMEDKINEINSRPNPFLIRRNLLTVQQIDFFNSKLENEKLESQINQNSENIKQKIEKQIITKQKIDNINFIKLINFYCPKFSIIKNKIMNNEIIFDNIFIFLKILQEFSLKENFLKQISLFQDNLNSNEEKIKFLIKFFKKEIKRYNLPIGYLSFFICNFLFYFPIGFETQEINNVLKIVKIKQVKFLKKNLSNSLFLKIPFFHDQLFIDLKEILGIKEPQLQNLQRNKQKEIDFQKENENEQEGREKLNQLLKNNLKEQDSIYEEYNQLEKDINKLIIQNKKNFSSREENLNTINEIMIGIKFEMNQNFGIQKELIKPIGKEICQCEVNILKLIEKGQKKINSFEQKLELIKQKQKNFLEQISNIENDLSKLKEKLLEEENFLKQEKISEVKQFKDLFHIPEKFIPNIDFKKIIELEYNYFFGQEINFESEDEQFQQISFDQDFQIQKIQQIDSEQDEQEKNGKREELEKSFKLSETKLIDFVQTKFGEFKKDINEKIFTLINQEKENKIFFTNDLQIQKSQKDMYLKNSNDNILSLIQGGKIKISSFINQRDQEILIIGKEQEKIISQLNEFKNSQKQLSEITILKKQSEEKQQEIIKKNDQDLLEIKKQLENEDEQFQYIIDQKFQTQKIQQKKIDFEQERNVKLPIRITEIKQEQENQQETFQPMSDIPSEILKQLKEPEKQINESEILKYKKEEEAFLEQINSQKQEQLEQSFKDLKENLIKFIDEYFNDLKQNIRILIKDHLEKKQSLKSQGEFFIISFQTERERRIKECKKKQEMISFRFNQIKKQNLKEESIIIKEEKSIIIKDYITELEEEQEEIIEENDQFLLRIGDNLLEIEKTSKIEEKKILIKNFEKFLEQAIPKKRIINKENQIFIIWIKINKKNTSISFEEENIYPKMIQDRLKQYKRKTDKIYLGLEEIVCYIPKDVLITYIPKDIILRESIENNMNNIHIEIREEIYFQILKYLDYENDESEISDLEIPEDLKLQKHPRKWEVANSEEWKKNDFFFYDKNKLPKCQSVIFETQKFLSSKSFSLIHNLDFEKKKEIRFEKFYFFQMKSEKEIENLFYAFKITEDKIKRNRKNNENDLKIEYGRIDQTLNKEKQNLYKNLLDQNLIKKEKMIINGKAFSILYINDNEVYLNIEHLLLRIFLENNELVFFLEEYQNFQKYNYKEISNIIEKIYSIYEYKYEERPIKFNRHGVYETNLQYPYTKEKRNFQYVINSQKDLILLTEKLKKPNITEKTSFYQIIRREREINYRDENIIFKEEENEKYNFIFKDSEFILIEDLYKVYYKIYSFGEEKFIFFKKQMCLLLYSYDYNYQYQYEDLFKKEKKFFFIYENYKADSLYDFLVLNIQKYKQEYLRDTILLDVLTNTDLNILLKKNFEFCFKTNNFSELKLNKESQVNQNYENKLYGVNYNFFLDKMYISLNEMEYTQILIINYFFMPKKFFIRNQNENILFPNNFFSEGTCDISFQDHLLVEILKNTPLKRDMQNLNSYQKNIYLLLNIIKQFGKFSVKSNSLDIKYNLVFFLKYTCRRNDFSRIFKKHFFIKYNSNFKECKFYHYSLYENISFQMIKSFQEHMDVLQDFVKKQYLFVDYIINTYLSYNLDYFFNLNYISNQSQFIKLKGIINNYYRNYFKENNQDYFEKNGVYVYLKQKMLLQGNSEEEILQGKFEEETRFPQKNLFDMKEGEEKSFTKIRNILQQFTEEMRKKDFAEFEYHLNKNDKENRLCQI